VFQRLDQNQDGKLQSSEMPEFVRDRILAADSDGDGIVTVEELKKHRETVSRR
jgi:Ca2+-binding EF-hand superfamily protein